MEPPHPETGAPAVIPPVIGPIIRGASVRDRIVTPYNADAFEAKLQALGLSGKHPDIPSRLRNGFPIGDFDEPLTRSYTPHNHLHNSEQLDFVLQYALEQVQLGHMSGPYTQSEVEEKLGGPFMSSPIFLIDKAGSPGKFRVIQNCSFKNRDGFAVNDFIDAEDFSTEWGNADEVLDIVARAPPGTQAASMDIASAYRNIPVLPSHKAFLVIQVRPGQFFIDHVCPFGPASGPGLQGQIMDAIVDILRKSGFGEIKKWVDDLVSFRSPDWKGAYPYDVEDIFHLSKELGIPWKRGKCFRYASRFVYVGFLWDLQGHWVALPEEKRVHCLEVLNAFWDRAVAGPVSLKDVRSITGTLSHAAFVHFSGKSYLAGLHTFIDSFPYPPKPQALPKQLAPDLQWWRATLQRINVVTSLRLFIKRDLDIWVDASAWGIGVMIGERSAAWKLVSGWDTDRRDINWAEMIALELACLYIQELGHNGIAVNVHCDSSSVVDGWDKGWSRIPQINLSIRRAVSVCMSCELKILPEHVASENNKADRLSRGLITCISDRLPPILLPPELRKLLITV